MSASEAHIRAANKYNQKNYVCISVRIEKDLAQQFREVVVAESDSVAGIFREAMTNYIEEHKKY